MGTRGLIAFRYKGYYYIKYNHWDSYPDGLGQDLVNAIPKSQKGFEKWVEDRRAHCEAIASESDEYEISRSPPKNDLFIEWTYTYDLDHLLFIVDSKAHFNLRNIAQSPPEEWIRFIGEDARGERCLSLETPLWLIGHFKHSKRLFLGEDPAPLVDDFVPTSTISPSTWSQPLTPHHRRLMLAQVNAIIAETYSLLCIFHAVNPTSKEVHEFATSFLEAIVPNNQVIVANRRSPTWNFYMSKKLGGPWFWYRGCLILLASDLDKNERFQVYVQAVAARAKAKKRDKCTVLLWSIRHVAVVEISDGVVSHSDPIPLLAAYGSDEDGFMNALNLLWHYLPYPRWRIVDQRPTPQETGDANFGKFSTEIVMRIMMFTDQLHYPKYQFLSHTFFQLWWNQLRVASYTILPDSEEIEDTSRCFTAYSADTNVPVRLRLKILWGIATGNIWRTDETDSSAELVNTWWSAHGERRPGNDEEDFSQGSNKTKYRLQRFYSYWDHDLATPRNNFLRVQDEFSSQRDIILCEAEAI